MATKRINMLSGVVLPIATVVVTIALFFLFMPEEPTALFWINLCYTLLLEGVFFGWLAFMRKDIEGSSSWLGVTLGSYGMIYCIAGVSVMLIYSILTAACGLEISIKWYVAILLVITLLWMIPAIFLTETDSNHELRQAELERNTTSVRNVSEELELLAKRYNDATENKFKLDVDRVLREVRSLPPVRFSKPENVQELDKIVAELQRGIDGGAVDFDMLKLYINRIKNN